MHRDVTEAVDALLRGRSLPQELRYRDVGGRIQIEQQRLETPEADAPSHSNGRYMDIARGPAPEPRAGREPRKLQERRILPFGVAQNRLLHAAQTLHVPVRIVDNLKEAHIFVTTKQYYRRRPRAVPEPSGVASPSTCSEPTLRLN